MAIVALKYVSRSVSVPDPILRLLLVVQSYQLSAGLLKFCIELEPVLLI
jgi:hypothetical protein